MKRSMSVLAPPLFLLVIGAAAYISVVKITTPEPIVVSGNGVGQTANPTPTTVIATGSALAATDQISTWQRAADDGREVWRTDSLTAAQKLGLSYGFDSTDDFSLESTDADQAVINAIHEGKKYTLTMYQPEKKGDGGIWVIRSISQE